MRRPANFKGRLLETQRRLRIAGASGAAVAILVPVIIAAVGFGPAGVGAGTAAAAWQSAAYGGFVPAGSAFATLQSLGMTAGSIYLGLGMGGATTLLVMLGYWARDHASKITADVREYLNSWFQQFGGWHHA